MYYSSATSQNVKLSSKSKNPDFIAFKPSSGEGRFRYKFFYLSAFFLCAFFVATFFNISSVYASKREIAEDYHRLGYEAQQNNEYSRALAYYFKASAVDPKNATYWNDIGLTYELLGKSDSALKSYLKAVRIDPKYLAPYANLGYVYQKKQDLVKAIYYLQKRIDLGDPSDPWTQKAREDLNDLYMSSPLYRDRFLDAESKRLNLQASQQTRENFKNQIKVANSEYERGMVLLKEQKSQKAIEAFNASLAFAPENPKVKAARSEAMKLSRAQQVTKRVNEAMLLLNQGNEKAAKQKFSEILAIIPNQAN